MRHRKRSKNPDVFTPRNIAIAVGAGIGVWLLIRELRKRGTLGNGGYGSKPVEQPKSKPSQQPSRQPSFWQRAKSVAAAPMSTQQEYRAPAPTPVLYMPTSTPVSAPTLQQTNIKPQYATYEPGQFDITGQPFKPTPPRSVVKDYELIDLVTHKPAEDIYNRKDTWSASDPATIWGYISDGQSAVRQVGKDIESGLNFFSKRDEELLKRAAVAESRFLTASRYENDDTALMRKRELEGVLRDITTLRKKRDDFLKREDEYVNEKIEKYSATARRVAGDVEGDEVFEELSALKAKALPKRQLPPAEEYEKGIKRPERNNYYERFKEAEKMFRQVNPNEALAYEAMLTSPASWDAKVKQFASERGMFQKSY